VIDHRRQQVAKANVRYRASPPGSSRGGQQCRRVIDLHFRKRLHAVIDCMTRREQVREAIRPASQAPQARLLEPWRPILVTKAQLDQLEERGYLNPGDRGTRADECEAIASFLADSLAKSR
jgi:hypothetical protein